MRVFFHTECLPGPFMRVFLRTEYPSKRLRLPFRCQPAGPSSRSRGLPPKRSARAGKRRVLLLPEHLSVARRHVFLQRAPLFAAAPAKTHANRRATQGPANAVPNASVRRDARRRPRLLARSVLLYVSTQPTEPTTQIGLGTHWGGSPCCQRNRLSHKVGRTRLTFAWLHMKQEVF